MHTHCRRLSKLWKTTKIFVINKNVLFYLHLIQHILFLAFYFNMHVYFTKINQTLFFMSKKVFIFYICCLFLFFFFSKILALFEKFWYLILIFVFLIIISWRTVCYLLYMRKKLYKKSDSFLESSTLKTR